MRGTGERIAFLDAVRGIAASLVVVEHLLEGIAPGYLSFALQDVNPGRAGVVAFFLVSGYVIPLSLSRQTLGTFATRRFFRLYPVYWVALYLLLLLDPSPLAGRSGLDLVLNLLMIVGGAALLPPAWTLTIELVFYAQAAVARLRGVLDRSVRAGWLWLATYTALVVAERATGTDLPTTFPMLLFAASLGHSLYLRDSCGSRAWRPLFAVGSIVVGGGSLLAADTEWSALAYTSSYALGLALFVGLYLLRGRTIWRPLVWLGSISYGIYLFHAPVLGALHDRAGLDGIGLGVGGAAAVVVVAYVVHVAVERPSIDLGRRLSLRRRPAAVAVAVT